MHYIYFYNLEKQMKNIKKTVVFLIFDKINVIVLI